MKKIILSVILLLLFTSCVWDSKNKDDIIPEYKGNVVWEKEFSYISSTVIPTLNGDSIYSFDTKSGYYSLYKLCLKDGTVCFDTQIETDTVEFEPVIHDDVVFVYCGYGMLRCFDADTGTLLATVKLMDKDSNQTVAMHKHTLVVSSDGKYLFWNFVKDCTNNINDDGIMRVTVSDIDFSKSAEEPQTVYAEMVWRGEYVDTNTGDDEVVDAKIVEENGLVYFITSPWCAKTFTTRLGCFAEDVETSNTVKWIREVPGFNGVNLSSLYILGDNIYVFENSIGCFDKKNGNSVWTRVQSSEDLKTEPYCGGLGLNRGGPFYDDGCFYYTTLDGWGSAKEYGCDQSLIGNIKCLNAKTGKLKWWYMPSGCGSLSTHPVVIDDKLYVHAAQSGLYLFDKTNGRAIGRDASVNGVGNEVLYVCDGNVIYFNYNTSSGTRTLTCIKP